MKVKLANVRPNPFRDIAVYPIDQGKVLSLKQSINSTEFWENILAREAGDGTIEIAYGHHRLQALREIYDENKEFDFIVKPLSNAEMIRIMSDENMSEWNHDAAIERETIKAIIKAAAAGMIKLPKLAPTTREDQVRYAPSFCFGKQAAMRSACNLPADIEPAYVPYTADTIVGFLSGTMTVDTVKYTLRALCLIEEGHLKEDQLAGLTSSQARVVVNETANAIKQAERIKKEADREALQAPTPAMEKKVKQEAEKKAKAVVTHTAKAVSTAIKGGKSASDAKAAARDARIAVQPQAKELPEINEAAKRVASQIMRLLDPEYDPGKKLTEIIKHKQYLEPSRVNDLDRALLPFSLEYFL